MQINMPSNRGDAYSSQSQRVRVISEAWAEESLFCPSCPSNTLGPCPPNTKVFDFVCPKCDSLFQLKSQSRPFARRITDAAYEAMRQAITENRTPNLFALHYDPMSWRVRNLILVPHFAFSLSSIEKRKPLGPSARRSGWVGCNILLANIPPEGKISVVVDGTPVRPSFVRGHYNRLRPLKTLRLESRGWTLDVLNVVNSLKKAEFSLAEIYGLDGGLQRLHPHNLHVKDKIRQQLQRLRDLGFLEFLGRGKYRLISQ